MFSNNSDDTVINNGREDEDLLNNSMNFSADTLHPTDRYDEYLAGDTMSKSSTSDSQNLFDDSNKEDRSWLKIAKEFLSRSAKS